MHIEVIHLFEGVSNATLTAYIQDASMDQRFPIIRPAIMICPGGAYIGITEKEADPVAMRFLAAGFHVFILRYSIGTLFGKFPAPFIDAAKSILLVRENAKRWCVDPDKIVLCGFSTGGHVAAVLGTGWQDAYLSDALGCENELLKPSALILCYPLLDLYQFNKKNLEKSSEMQPLLEMMFAATFGSTHPSKEMIEEWNCNYLVTKQLPPTFLWTTAEDALVDIEENLDFIKALALSNIPYEFHVFEKGAHGLSLGDQTVGYSKLEVENHKNASKWVELALIWLENYFSR